MPVSIHVNVILFSIILVVLTMVGTAFFMYNAFGKPFETLHGPLGLYLLSFISGEDRILPQTDVSECPKTGATQIQKYSMYIEMLSSIINDSKK